MKTPPPTGLPGTAEEENLNFEAFRSTVAQADESPSLAAMIAALARSHNCMDMPEGGSRSIIT
jgi:hypothetical protein